MATNQQAAAYAEEILRLREENARLRAALTDALNELHGGLPDDAEVTLEEALAPARQCCTCTPAQTCACDCHDAPAPALPKEGKPIDIHHATWNSAAEAKMREEGKR